MNKRFGKYIGVFGIMTLIMTGFGVSASTAAEGHMHGGMDHQAQGVMPQMEGSMAHDGGENAHMGHDAAPDNGAVYTTTGSVVSVDAASGKAEISHAAIAALNWPAMTMRFVFEDPAALEDLKPGDRIRFDFHKSGSDYVILGLEKE